MKNIKVVIVFIVLLSACSEKEVYRENYPNGAVKTEGVLIDGLKIGKWSLYDSLGNLQRTHFYENDTLKIREFYADGKLSSWEEMNGENIKHGVTKTFYISGQLESQSNYVYNEEIGDHISYYPNGKLRSKYVNMENDQATDFHQYYPNGQLFVYAKNMENGEINFYDSLGNRTYDVLYENSFPVDTLKIY